MAITPIATLNQILDGLEDIADAHGQINTFGKGDVWEMATSGVTEYPVMWVDLENVTRSKNITAYNFTFYILDLVQKGEGNEWHVLSDTHKIAEDIIAELRHPSWTWNLRRDSDITINNFTEKLDDMLSGVSFQIPIQVVMPDDRCQIPATTITRF